MEEEIKRKRRKRKKTKDCDHQSQRKVFGRDGRILWFECESCGFDYPLM